MIRKVTLIFAASALTTGACFAQANVAETNARRAYVEKLQACRKQAKDQQLNGEESRTFVASCMKH